MPGVYVGKTKALVFPMLCDGYINLDYSEMNATDTELSLRQGVWSPRNTFTLEAIITPYDINGYGSRTTGFGTLDSEKTSPQVGETESNKTHYQSYQRLGATQNNKKMSIFYNTNLHLYLENMTTTNINQPSEWRLVADFPQATAETRYVTTPTLIKSHNTLHGYYDETAWYDGISTSRRRITTSATNVTPTATIVCNRHTDIPYDEKATAAAGNINITDNTNLPAYVTAVKATGQIDFDSINMPCNQNEAIGTGSIEIVKQEAGQSEANNNVYVQITDGTNTYRFYPMSSIAGGKDYDDLSNVEGFGSGDWGYQIGANDTTGQLQITAGNLAQAINAVGWANPHSQLDLADNSTMSSTKTLSTNPYFTSVFNGNVTLGSGTTANFWNVTNISGGNPGTEVNDYITITSYNPSGTDVVRRYKASPHSNTTNGEQATTNGGSVNVILYRNGTSLHQTAVNFRTALGSANGHNGAITYTGTSYTDGAITLVQNNAGTGGNLGISFTSGIINSGGTAHATKTDFSGGVNLNNPNQYVSITDNQGTPNTTKYKFLTANDAKSNGDTLGDYKLVKLGNSATNTLINWKTVIEANQNLIIGGSGASRPITCTNTGTGGNNSTPTKSGTIGGLTLTTMTGGTNIVYTNSYISIYDDDGVEKKYKGSKSTANGGLNYSNGQLANGYVHYVIGTYAGSGGRIATMNNLRTAILSTDGHNGSISVTPVDSSESRTLTIGAAGSQQNNTLQGTWPEVSSVKSFTTQAWQTQNTANITLQSGEAANIGVGETIYNSNGETVGTVSSVTGDVLAMGSSPSNVTSTLYASQPREALYLDSVYKISLVYNDTTGRVELYINNSLQKEAKVSITDTDANDYKFEFDASDCKIGQGSDNTTQFYGELYEIAMSNKAQTSLTSTTLSPGYSDIVFYYRFDEDDS